MMLTRTEFKNETGLTRKALRVYEDKGLLRPQEYVKRQALYQHKDVERAILIRLLRQAGIPVAQIENYLMPTCADVPYANAAETQLREALERVARNARDALDHLDAFARGAKRKIQRFHHGGTWAWGCSARISKSRVTGYVSGFARSLRRAGIPSDRIAARYENESKETVDITCYTEIDVNDRLPNRDGDGKRLFIPEGIYLAIRASGLFGQYNCFDSAYEALNSRKSALNRSKPSGAPVEIYVDYPHDGVHGQPFEALIMV